ncbi:DUF3089 domain-containing protein [Hydrocarboniclastica marina]|uniref:DUF3089 domain-containing protein n=1 Tax=Hydrocarboniclastica marina TaxID=2259620 RepID=A0A4P7XII7_9ALTE|nr:DUF3089 domain-containing protein [Hydrocarboniclastica marina]QCF26122.1 DUF3089 domain-containing protein [Hydrocarboniclastica marina]
MTIIKTTIIKTFLESGLLLAFSVALLLPQLSLASDAGTPPYDGYMSDTYSGSKNWLCHPGLSSSRNVCDDNIRALSVEADGSSDVVEFRPESNPAVDCFYVYPTASIDAGPNSNLFPGAQEEETTQAQAARYSEVCRMFAPVYRQRTLTYLALDTLVDDLVSDETVQRANEVAYADVLDAFREYIAYHNQGRGFILVGHSQGSRLLSRLIAEEVEQNAYLSQRLIAAHLPGYSIAVPKGADVGGTFAKTPACRRADQTGCVIGYASYRKGDPELADARFGITDDPGTQALCVNPAALAGGKGDFETYLPFRQPPVYQALMYSRGSGGPYASRVRNKLLPTWYTPYFTIPGQLSGECIINAAGVSYLEVSIKADPSDPRADDYPGEFLGGTGWGLHLGDISLVQGNLVELARSQSEAWLAAQQD